MLIQKLESQEVPSDKFVKFLEDAIGEKVAEMEKLIFKDNQEAILSKTKQALKAVEQYIKGEEKVKNGKKDFFNFGSS